MSNIKIFLVVVGLLILGTVTTVIMRSNVDNVFMGPGKYDNFATCLKDKGAVFYGAFWCPHCQAQKKRFGSSQKLLSYIECSTTDSNGQLQVCNDAKIQAYPTWKFSDGAIKEGLAEPAVKDLRVDEIIQFERKFFARLDKKEKDKLCFVYTHK